MAKADWQRAKEIFLAALDQPADSRGAFVEEQCGGDAGTYEEVISLLSSHADADGFIERPAFSVRDVFQTGSALVGKTIGSYRVVSEVGHGGMGSVFLGEHTDGEFRQQVAIKVVRPGLDTADIRRRFVHERQILAGLEHPFIARLIDGGTTDDGLPYLVMEYVRGQPITLFARDLDLKERLRLFQKVCEAVSYAHRNLVIHRDLKPSNIFVTADGGPKLLDFGIAKLLDASGAGGQTLTGVGAFTPDYASPEQIKGSAITTASDVYSLGVVLYELLTGRSPYRFSTRSPDELIRVICDESPSSPSRRLSAEAGDPLIRPGDLAGDLENIVLLALRKEPERRYASVEQFSGDIQRHLDGLPVIAREDTVGYRISKFIGRHRVAATMGALLVLILAGGLITTAWQASIARQQRDAAMAERVRAERMNEFLQEMLSYSNQSWNSVAGGRSRDVTINQMLDEIAPRIETELADQPDMRARMLRTIANAYNSQGRYAVAEQYLRSALTIQTELYGENHRETLTTKDDLGESLFQLGKQDDAIALYDQLVLVLREKQSRGPDDGDTYLLAAALHGLGSSFVMKGEADKAIGILREASATVGSLDLAQNELGLAAEIKLNLGAALLARGDLLESEALLRESLAVFRSLRGHPRWEMGVVLSKLGECLVRQNNFAEADLMLHEGERIYANTIGEANNYLTRNLNYQAQAALGLDDLSSAEKLSRRALDIYARSDPPVETVQARTLLTLGTALCRMKKGIEGKQFLTRSAAIYQRTGGVEVQEAMTALRSCEK